MSDHSKPSDRASPPPSAPAAGGGHSSPKSRPPRPRRGAMGPIALIVALVALAGVTLGGWQWWQWRQARQADAAATARLEHQLAAVQSDVDAARRARDQEKNMLQALRGNHQALGQRLDGMATRIDSLENAVASLARHNQHGRRAMLLDQAELLLRMGRARYTLFHDAAGALKAYGLADQTLAAVGDPALAGVRHTLAGERKALAAMRPASRAQDLATLSHLRAIIPQLPLKRLDAGTGEPASHGFWHRVWHALSTAVVVRRTHGSPQSLADARLTRQLAALDVAQAEAARLAWDHKAFHAALERVARALSSGFDADDAAVRKARATVTKLLAESAATAAPATLGKALQQLRNLRAVRGVQGATPAAAASAPQPAAPASSSPATGSSST